jgi:uncharacterized protein
MTISAFEGFGLGLRKPHYSAFLEERPPVDFLEVISENFMVEGGQPRRILRQIRERYPVALHGVSMSIGSADGVDLEYLIELRKLIEDVDPLFVSDHLCWTRTGKFNSHDLLPVPFTNEALDIVAANISRAQDVLDRSVLIENPSSYLAFDDAEMTEWSFLEQLCERTGCGMLLDINNIFVSACNNGFNAVEYLDGICAQHVRQIHLAGHSVGRNLLIDTHDSEVCSDVWDLYQYIRPRLGPVATMIERDDEIPAIEELLAELDVARGIADTALRNAA